MAKTQWREMDERAEDSVSAGPIRFSVREEADADIVVAETGPERDDRSLRGGKIGELALAEPICITL